MASQIQTADAHDNLYADLEVANYSFDEVYALAKDDMDFFSSLALPQITEYAYPPIYIIIWWQLIELANRTRDFSKVAIGFPRGFAKTSVIKLLILYLVLFTTKRHIAVICSTATHAQNIISDIADMLDEDNIKAVFGDWRIGITKDTQEQKRFGFRGRNVILTAIGQGGAVRGLNIKHARPDVMIFDDIQTREDADSETISTKIKQWMLGTAMKAASHKGCLYIFLGNMYPTDNSLLKWLKHNVEWVKYIVGGLIQEPDGSYCSLWPELKPTEQLEAEYINDLNSGFPEVFLAEVLNDETAVINNSFDPALMPAYPFADNEISAGNFIIIDPSNDKVNSDAVTISVNSIFGGRPVVVKICEGRFSPEDTIIESLKLAMEYGCSLIVIEANAYQYSLKFWMDKYKAFYGMFELNVEPIYSGKRSKNSRILDMFKSLISGSVFIHPDAWAPVMNQIRSFDPQVTNNTDGILDCVTYIMPALVEYKHLITVYNVMNAVPTQEMAGSEITSII